MKNTNYQMVKYSQHVLNINIMSNKKIYNMDIMKNQDNPYL